MPGYFVCISLSGVAFDAAMMYRVCITVHMDFLYISIVNNRWRESGDHKASGNILGTLGEIQRSTVRQKGDGETEGEGLQNNE